MIRDSDQLRGDGRFGDACLSIAHFVLALGVDGIRPPKDHDAFLRVEKAIPILARRTSFVGCCLLALAFFRPASLSQEALEELIVFVEVFDGVSMVGARAIHELVKVVKQALLGLLARAISHGDQRGVGRLAAILSILFPL